MTVLHRIVQDGDTAHRAELDGGLTRGALMVDADTDAVRWVAERELLDDMQGVGVYSGATGYPAYTNTPPKEDPQ